MLVLPCVPTALVAFEEFAVRHWRRTASLNRYLVQRHGLGWLQAWAEICQGRRVSVAQRAEQGPAKRRRVLNTVGPLQHTKGGTDNFDERELELDVSRGWLVLQQVLQSK